MAGKRKLTSVKQALRWTRDMWAWLAKNPGMQKNQWPGWTNRQGCENTCACCQITPRHPSQPWRPDCSKCPLFELWCQGSSKEEVQAVLDDRNGYLCSCLQRSPYYPFLMNLPNKTESALTISKAAGAAMKK